MSRSIPARPASCRCKTKAPNNWGLFIGTYRTLLRAQVLTSLALPLRPMRPLAYIWPSGLGLSAKRLPTAREHYAFLADPLHFMPIMLRLAIAVTQTPNSITQAIQVRSSLDTHWSSSGMNRMRMGVSTKIITTMIAPTTSKDQQLTMITCLSPACGQRLSGEPCRGRI